jgi:hypothetical protein
MTSLAAIPITDGDATKRKEDADILRRLADQVESGEVTEFVAVANDRELGAYYRASVFADRWRILGALEYARQSIHDCD